MKQADLIRSLDTTDYGADWVHFGDLNGDGRPEMVFRQGPAMLDSKIFTIGRFEGWISPEDQAVYCLTATDMEGTILWQVGEPFRGEKPYRTHGGNRMTQIADVDGDGRDEVVLIRYDRLLVYDGLDGSVKKECVLPYDNFCRVLPVNVSGGDYSGEVLAQCGDEAYPPYTYANPAILYDRNLDVLWPERSYVGAGHNPNALDVDGDGRDELFIGYTMVDHTGEILWALDIPDPSEHVDYRVLDDLDGDGEVEIAYAGSKDALLVSLRGEILWKKEHHHIQRCATGKYRSDVDGRQVVFCEKHQDQVYCYRHDGIELWNRKVRGYARTLTGAGEDGPDLILFESPIGGFPYALDGRGEEAFRFEGADGYEVPPFEGRQRGDWGLNLKAELCDIDGDGRGEILVHDRRQMWIYAVPQ